MGVERLERVLWRVRKWNPNQEIITYKSLQRAIMFECGTSPETYKRNVRALKLLTWISPHDRGNFKLTNKDLSDS